MDIVERLRRPGDEVFSTREKSLIADELQRLRVENAELRATVEAYKNQDPAGWCIQQQLERKSFTIEGHPAGIWSRQMADDCIPLFTNKIEAGHE